MAVKTGAPIWARPDATVRAMQFARAVHAKQKREYTGGPYFDHLAQVAGLVAAVGGSREAIAAALLHDCREDQGVTHQQLLERFGPVVADAVGWLSDLETGTREERKASALIRLGQAPGWVQTIKVADIISNVGSVAALDPEFAAVYLPEKRAQLAVMTHADPTLLAIAAELLTDPKR